ncbi:MAG: hypothetical protein ABI632_07140 [Pseudolysinimonas sp.]
MTDYGPSVDGAGPQKLRSLLQDYAEAMRHAGAPADTNLADGLPAGEIGRQLASTELPPNAELIEWFAWSNGLRLNPDGSGAGVHPFMSPVSLEYAIANYEYGSRLSQTIWSYAPDWFPMEIHPHGLSVSPTYSDQTLLVRRPDEELPLAGDDIRQQVLSLCTVVEWTVEAIRAEICHWDGGSSSWKFDLRGLPEIQLGTAIL